jgi:hypothetical protein
VFPVRNVQQFKVPVEIQLPALVRLRTVVLVPIPGYSGSKLMSRPYGTKRRVGPGGYLIS